MTTVPKLTTSQQRALGLICPVQGFGRRQTRLIDNRGQVWQYVEMVPSPVPGHVCFEQCMVDRRGRVWKLNLSPDESDIVFGYSYTK